MRYIWSITEVFLIDIALVKPKRAKQIYNCMKSTAQGYEFHSALTSPVKNTSPIKSPNIKLSNTGNMSNSSQNGRLVSGTKKRTISNASSGGDICIISEETFVNVIIKANTHSKFTSWQVFEYSHASHFVDKLMIGSRMETSKVSRGELKVAIKKFAFVRVDEPFQYRLAVRCKSNSSADAQKYLDIIKDKIDVLLSTVTRLETFKYGAAMDQMMREIMGEHCG